MYTSTEDARSDLFLAGAVFLFGGVIVQALLRVIPLDRVPGLGIVLLIVLPLATSVLVPFLLIRYRKEPWSMYGLAGFAPSGFGFGVLLGLPLTLATVVGALIAQTSPASVIPLAGLVGGTEISLTELFSRIARWLGYALLAVYGTVKARDAFRGEPQTLLAGARQIGGILGIAVGVAAALLLASMAAQGRLGGGLPVAADLLLVPLGIATALFIVVTSMQGTAGTTTRPTLVTPAVLLGMAAIRGIGFDAVTFVFTIYIVGLLALVGLLVGVLLEWRGSAWPAVGLGLAIAALTTFV